MKEISWAAAEAAIVEAGRPLGAYDSAWQAGSYETAHRVERYELELGSIDLVYEIDGEPRMALLHCQSEIRLDADGFRGRWGYACSHGYDCGAIDGWHEVWTLNAFPSPAQAAAAAREERVASLFPED